MRKIIQFHDTDKPDPGSLLLAVDVSSQILDLYSRYRQDWIEYELVESFSNDLTTIACRLDYYHEQVRVLGYSGLSIVVEPSGCYETKLTGTAIAAGHRVWMVNPERMPAAIALTRKDRLLGPYYHRKIAEGMPGGKAKVACMRKLVKIL